jgi:sugar phosphate isomerase/epimerase
MGRDVTDGATRGAAPRPAGRPATTQPDRRAPLRLGASTLFVAHSEPFTPALLDLLRGLGVVSIEIADYHANFDYDDPAWLDRAKGWLAERGLALNSVHAHFEQRRRGSDLAAPDESVRRDSVAIYRGGLAALARLGGDILVTHHIAIPSPESQPAEHAPRRAAFTTSLRELAPVAADLGVRLAIENGGSGWHADVNHLRALIAEAGAAGMVGICLDTGHQHLQHGHGDVAGAVRAAGSALITLHIHDNHGGRDEHIMPFDGTIDWPPVVGALREIGYAGVFMYEAGKDADITRLPENYQALMGKSTKATTGTSSEGG